MTRGVASAVVVAALAWSGRVGAETLSPANGAPQVCIDTQLAVTFNRPPQIGSAGLIRVLRADGTLADSIDLADPNSARKPIGGAVSDNGTLHLFNYFPIIVDGNTAWIQLHHALSYGQTYAVSLDPGVLDDGAGFSGIGADGWRFTTKPAPPSSGSARLDVAVDGSGDFCTVQGAIDFVPTGNTRPVVIDVHKGTYREINYVPPSKPFITVRGEDRDATVIEYANNDRFNVAPVSNSDNQCIQRRLPGTPDLYNCWRSLFGVEATDFTLENITLHNTTPFGGSQAEAFRGNNDRIVLNRIKLVSFQDTLRLQMSGFVTNSYIEGDVDFTWGTGAVFFQKSELKSLHAGYDSMVRNDQAIHGNVYVGNRLTRDAAVPANSVYLSRIEPLRFPYSEAVFVNNAMDAQVRAVGWQLNPTGTTCAQAPNIRFFEYGSIDLNGAPVDTSQRLSCSRQLSDTEAAQWSDPAFVLNGRVPTTLNAMPAGVPPGPTPGPTTPGSIVIVNWSASTNHAADDWIGLFRAGTPDSQVLARQFVPGGTTGTLDFTLPATPGRYEFRYFATGGSTHAAASNVVTALPSPACAAQASGQSGCAP